MFVASFKHTEAGANRVMLSRLESERALRVAAEQRADRLMLQVVEQAAAERPIYPVYRSTFRMVEERAMKLFRVTRQMLHSQRRHKDVVFARQFVMYWAVRKTNLSLPRIGKLMGGRDHTTVMAGREAYRAKREKMGRFLPKAR